MQIGLVVGLMLLFFSSCVLLTPIPVQALVSAIEEEYTYLAPLPGTITSVTEGPGGQKISKGDLGTYLWGIYKLAIGVAGVLAVLMITIGGIRYMVSEAISGKEAARKQITDAIIGLLLAFLSYLILYTINPDLIKLNLAPGVIPVETPPKKAGATYVVYPSINGRLDCRQLTNPEQKSYVGRWIFTYISGSRFNCGGRVLTEERAAGGQIFPQYCCEYLPPPPPASIPPPP